MGHPRDMSPAAEKRRAYRRKRYAENPDVRRRHLEAAQRYRKALKVEILQEYGGKCACCGETNLAFLCIDHVDSGGLEHRRQINNEIYTWLKRQGFPKEGFQVLCFNCNLAKGLYGECPISLEFV